MSSFEEMTTITGSVLSHGTKTSSTSAPPGKRMITAVLPCHNPTALSSRKNQLIALEELPLRLRTSPCRAQPCPPASGPALNAVLLNFLVRHEKLLAACRA